MVLSTYGRSTGFCVDPIEKKPLNHFYPGTSVLSFGTAGCNLGCKFCQNWDISKSRKVERLSEQATPEAIANAAKQLGCHSVAFTYNDPVIWAEYAIDVAAACHEQGVKTVAVTAGYITDAARPTFFNAMDAANVDLKAFTEDFYYKLTSSHIDPVLDTLRWLRKESDVWFEITNLIIPQANDSREEIRRMSDWILSNLGDDVPIHFTAFHPDFRMTDRPRTPHETLLAAYEEARSQGLKYVYVGNVHDSQHDSTYCPTCKKLVIERDWHQLGKYYMNSDRCAHCGGQITGRFESKPGTWGRRRLPVQISQFSKSLPVIQPNQSESKMSTVQTADNAMLEAAQQRPQFTKEQEEAIHRATCEIVAAEVCRHKLELSDKTLGGTVRTVVMGAFVTAKRQDKLRGCCGTLGRPYQLMQALHPAAVRTATQDMRLPPISPSELEFLDISVTLLYGFKPLESRGPDRINEVEVGLHGLQIQRGNSGGLLLPSVPVENGWDSQQFLNQVCRKAGLPVTAWQDEDTSLRTFEGLYIGAPFNPEVVPAWVRQPRQLFTESELGQLLNHTRINVSALIRGATPNYYMTGAPEGNVSGIALTLRIPGSDDVHVSQISMRPGIPLQSTLFTLTEAAARAAQQIGVDATRLAQVDVGITLLSDPAMHGTVGEPDLRGLDPSRRALILTEGQKTVWTFDPNSSQEGLLKTAADTANVLTPNGAALYSLAALSTLPSVVVSNVPRPQPGTAIRPPGVAGRFYPANPSELDSLVDKCFEGTERKPEPWPAIMVPHAGLIYSGRIAASVLQRTEIPEKVIVIGPKHTRNGVAWAVAPHQTWSLPGGDMQSDVELAKQLADSIPGLELDAAAHQQEHGIEVELPLLRRIAPDAKVVGIAMNGGNLDRCREFATGLADVMRKQEKPPLLIISSDMNHYATDEENRRLDEIALKAIDQLDPETIYKTVTGNNISMCGVLPAVVILDTLKQLNVLTKSQRVAYGTSADVSGDKSRVVGYAGMLFG